MPAHSTIRSGNQMTQLLNKIERRLGLSMLPLPDAISKNTWHTVIEEDLFNLKYIEYNIRYGSLYYRHGILKTLRKVIKNLEKEGKQ
mgnify:CR=1 FL=1